MNIGIELDQTHDVWLGHGVTVLPGVTIGIGAAVGVHL